MRTCCLLWGLTSTSGVEALTRASCPLPLLPVSARLRGGSVTAAQTFAHGSGRAAQPTSQNTALNNLDLQNKEVKRGGAIARPFQLYSHSSRALPVEGPSFVKFRPPHWCRNPLNVSKGLWESLAGLKPAQCIGDEIEGALDVLCDGHLEARTLQEQRNLRRHRVYGGFPLESLRVASSTAVLSPRSQCTTYGADAP